MTIAGAGAALVESLAAISAAEWIAVLLALAYLLLAVRQNPWCWACAIASAGIYLVLFARGGLYMQSALQVFYVAMSAYGWYAWRGGGAGPGEALVVSRWGAGRHAVAIVAVLAIAVANGTLIRGIVAWHCQEGERIEEGAPLLTVQTEKVDSDARFSVPGPGRSPSVCLQQMS